MVSRIALHDGRAGFVVDGVIGGAHAHNIHAP